MKKIYLKPAIKGHKLRVESLLTSTSPINRTRIEWGNMDKSQSIVNPDETQTSIDVVEGPGVENI